MEATETDLESVRVFVAVVEAGSFTAAGKRLGLPKSSVSRRVGQLEEQLGARLLHRTTRRLSLTDVGELFHARAARSIDDLRDACQAVGRLQSEPRGLLRVTCPADLGAYLIAELVDRFVARYPDVQVGLLATSRKVDLVAEGIDLALRAGSMPDSSMMARRLVDSRFGVYGGAEYLARHGRPARVADLAQHVCLPFGQERASARWVFQGPDGEQAVQVSGPFGCNDLSMLRAAAERGMGLTLQPCMSRIGPGPHLERVLPEYDTMIGALWALYPSARHLSPKVRAFIDFTLEYLRAQVADDSADPLER